MKIISATKWIKDLERICRSGARSDMEMLTGRDEVGRDQLSPNLTRHLWISDRFDIKRRCCRIISFMGLNCGIMSSQGDRTDYRLTIHSDYRKKGNISKVFRRDNRRRLSGANIYRFNIALIG